MNRHVWAAAFRVTVPVLIGYLAIGIAFGLMLEAIGYNFIWAFFMSLTIYAGSGQYLGVSLLPVPGLSLVFCALCGLSVGIMWPGTFSKASSALPRGGTAMFALLALGGDVGCGGGPTVVGFVSGALGDNLKLGILAGVAFPILLLIGIFLCAKNRKRA